MPNPQVATSTDKSNIANIVDAAFAIARDHTGVTWAGTTEWDFPTDHAMVATPWLAVPWPAFVEHSVGYVPVGDFMDRSMEVQFTWDIEVYCLATYEAGNPLTYSVPTDTGADLLKVFTLYENLNGTCEEMKVGKLQLAKLYERSPNGGPVSGPPLFFTAMVPLRVIEQIETDYTPAP